ncbi:Inositolphosphorylceramide synthase subunit Kei1-domain-containing protein [Tirmania nivea]|nr:Inositolphosphorylceramide synthase subunit Kei1-domain-containing protein [Tirmania nivea]
MSILRSLHLPRPKRFLYFLPLPLGTTIIAYTLLINKISGLYGLLALLTGASLTLPQLLMYIYSLLIAFLLVTWLIPGISDKKPAEAVVFTWVFGVDSLVNAAFTGLFAAGWYLNGPGATLYAHSINSAGGNIMGIRRNATTGAVEGDQIPVVASDSSNDPASAAGQLPAESVASITIIAVLWLIRIYFFLVVLAFSRAVVRGEDFDGNGASAGGRYTGFRSPALRGVSAIEAETGWKGKIGRALVGVNRGYWEEEVKGGSEWMRLGDAEERGRVRRGGSMGDSVGSSRSQSLRRD